MLRGGLLAGLAGTATVCAALMYLNPQVRRDNPGGRRDAGSAVPSAAEDAHGASDSVDSGSSREGTGDGHAGGDKLPTSADRLVGKPRPGLSNIGAAMLRLVAKLRPSTRNMVSAFGDTALGCAGDMGSRLKVYPRVPRGALLRLLML